MKIFSTYLQLNKKISTIEFIEMLFLVYEIDISDLDLNQKRIIEDNFEVYQFSDVKSTVVHLYHQIEYIYNEMQGGLCIRNDGNKKGYCFIDWLLSHDMIIQGEIPICDQAFMIDLDRCQQMIAWIQSPHRLPMIYVNYEKVIDPGYIARQLRGIAHVVYEKDHTVHQYMIDHCNIISQKGRVVIYYLNQDYKIYRFSKNESQDLLQQRILHNISMYLKQRQYSDVYNFHRLQINYLEKLKLLAGDYEKETIFHLDAQMKKLEDDKKRYSQLIEQLDNEIRLIQMENDLYEEDLAQQNRFVILEKGDIKEYYGGEQKDILLNMLENDVKKKKIEHADVLEEILLQNPKEGTRDRYLNSILKLLKSSYDIVRLKNYGINIKSGKSKHLIATFFDDARYSSTISSTPSDQNACRQIYRQLRKYFF